MLLSKGKDLTHIDPSNLEREYRLFNNNKRNMGYHRITFTPMVPKDAYVMSVEQCKNVHLDTSNAQNAVNLKLKLKIMFFNSHQVVQQQVLFVKLLKLL